MITISLCMIVKNEAAVLERILKPMSAIADQIDIVDTGSADETKEIARRYTDDVYEMDWRDDFSAARNLACSYARMDYWMWLDADDVIDEENAARLLDLKHSLPPSADVAAGGTKAVLPGIDRREPAEAASSGEGGNGS